MRNLKVLCFAALVGFAVPAATPQQQANGPNNPDSTANSGENSAAMSNESTFLRKDMRELRVVKKLAASPALEGADITVEVDGNTAKLSGSVAEKADVERAKHLANRVRGINQVNNQLTVSSSGKDSQAPDVSDEELAKTTAEAIHKSLFPNAELEEQWLYGWEIEGDDWELEVEADGRTIILEGDVDTIADVSKVIQTARNVAGVRSVDASGLRIDHDYYGYPYDYYPWYRF